MGTMEQHKHLLGQWAEQTALLFLQSQQYQYVNKTTIHVLEKLT